MTKAKKDEIDGQNILYHILQKKIIQTFDADNPPDEIKFMIEQLLLWGGVWFTTETYEQIPILRPYVIRDSSCRNRDPRLDVWAQANNKGLMRDDNSSIKDIPKSLKILSSWKDIKGKTLGNGWVASHVWTSMLTRKKHSCEWERANSFIPNLVWLPSQLSKLTDREGSYAQKFIQHISYELYYSKIINPMFSEIWYELNNPGITPVSKFTLDELNYFDYGVDRIKKKKNVLELEMQSIIDILNDPDAVVKRVIYNDKYTTTLRDASKKMDPNDKKNFLGWINANLDYYKRLASK
ncbi:MAG: hypothetical protein J6T48_02460 [Bacteroidales bacterium]|nr:hypothetical protein [Bacteroidales bacterium]